MSAVIVESASRPAFGKMIIMDRRVRWLFLFSFLVAVVVVVARPVIAQGGSGVSASTTFHYTFGQAMHFSLQAQGEQPITAAALYFSATGMENAFVVPVAVQAGLNVAVGHTVPASQVGLSPFALITYWWTLTLEDGQVISLPEQQVEYLDDRFVWQTLVAEDVTVRWTEADDETVARAALDVVAATRPRLNALLPNAPAGPLRIFIYPTTADLRSALRLTGRDGDGTHLSPELDAVLVAAVNPRTAALDLGKRLPHEMAHLRLAALAGENGPVVPLWFQEGLAAFVETAPDPSYDRLVQEAVTGRETLSFDELCNAFPAGESNTTLAQAQSAALVRYIAARHGEMAVTQLAQAYAAAVSCQEGIERVLDRSPAELHTEWLAAQQPQTGLARLWAENGIWLLMLAAGFLFMALMAFPAGRGTEIEK